MDLRHMLKATESFVTHNSPTILTFLGVTGTVTTAYLTGKAAFRAADLLHEEEEVWRLEGGPDFRHKVETVWMEFIPPAIAGSLTVAAIIAANRIGSRRTAAIAAAFQITERAYTEYQDKVQEEFGADRELRVRQSIAKDRIARTDTSQIVVVSGKSTFIDAYSSRPFLATYEEVLDAQNWINYELINNMHATLSDYYDRLGIPHTSISGDVGWNCDSRLELEITPGMTEDRRPALVVDFRKHPFPEYGRLH